MATKAPISLESASRQAREISPFFSLPNEDGSNSQYDSDQSQQSQLSPITLSCASCERIVGDSSAFLCATRQMGTITLDKMVSVAFGSGGLKTSVEGKWDEFCNYKDITCGKCSAALGKMYFATTSKLSALQNKYTLNLLALSFYHHASATPSLPIAATSEIYAQLHPDPETVAENIDHIMTICVMLREEQGDIIRELKKLGAATGIDMDLDEGEAVAAKESWREKVDALDGVVKKVKELEERVEEMRRQLEIKAQEFEERLPLKENKLPRKKIYDDFVVGDLIYPPPRRQEKDKDKKAQKATPPAVVMNKRKRKPGTETATTATAGKLLYIDLSNDEYTPAPGKPKSKKEVPNSQSADEDDGEYQDEQGNDEQEEEEEEEEIEDKVKSPAEKRRKGIAVSIVSQKEVAGRRVSLGRKGK